MKIKTIIAAAFTAVITTTGANAASLNLTSMLNFEEDGMRSSLVHKQDYPEHMSGDTKAVFFSTLEGKLEMDGSIWFNGQYQDSFGTHKYSAKGQLNPSGSVENGLWGYISFNSVGGLFNGGMTFGFLDKDYNPDANRFASGRDDGPYAGVNFVGLWGSTCLREKQEIVAAKSAETCYGIDLRIQHDGNPDGGAIPLPASAFLLLAGIGGLGVTRKLRKKA